ncbi:MAG: hypothetical protein L7S63_08415, partial [Flavobacteriales bacterium]|nr:hypothetical protein [Flavobacteriales bacterium]
MAQAVLRPVLRTSAARSFAGFPGVPAMACNFTFADSVLQCPEAAKFDSTWLNINGVVQVVRGGQLYRHDLVAPEHVRNTYIHVAGNDFKKGGPTVKGALPPNFERDVLRKLRGIHNRTHGTMTFILWGDWDAWSNGFTDADSITSGERYNSFCRELLNIANAVCEKVVWLHAPRLAGLARTSDHWHFQHQAKPHIQLLLAELGVELDLPAPDQLPLLLEPVPPPP